MAIRMTGTEAHLEGDWTLTAVTRNVDALAQSLQQFEPGNEQNLSINCREVGNVDSSGMQLLNVWLQCVRFRGVEPTLVNVPESLRHAMQGLDFKQYLSDNFPGPTMIAT